MTRVAIVGAGPAGLMAADVLSQRRAAAFDPPTASSHAGGTAPAPLEITIFERMPRPARKFLLAGRGGLNLTNTAEPDAFARAYTLGHPPRAGGDNAIEPALATLTDAVARFDRPWLEAWCHDLGIETFIGSSGRVFPKQMKASPLLRAWLRRLDARGVILRTRHRLTAIAPAGDITFDTPDGVVTEHADALILGLGGASWPRLGSDGTWADAVRNLGIDVTAFAPSNAAIHVPWSDHLRATTAGAPLKRVAVTLGGRTVRGDLVITNTGLEGGPIYALSPELRAALDAPRSDQADAAPRLMVDLRPDVTTDALNDRIARAKSSKSTSTILRSAAGLSAAAVRLLREPCLGALVPTTPAGWAERIKAVSLPMTGMAGLDRAISSVGGVAMSEIDAAFGLRGPQHAETAIAIHVVGEMLDWDAPTGGYLLHAALASGAVAGHALADAIKGSDRQLAPNAA
ncbi:MAG: TIGR03862 family flavoprotein [Pseudomonadota bacterium]